MDGPVIMESLVQMRLEILHLYLAALAVVLDHLSGMQLNLFCAGIGINVHLNGPFQKNEFNTFGVVICLEVECRTQNLHIHITR